MPRKGEIAWLPTQEVYLKSFIAAGCLDGEYLANATKLLDSDPEAFQHPVIITSVREEESRGNTSTTDGKKVVVKFHTVRTTL